MTHNQTSYSISYYTFQIVSQFINLERFAPMEYNLLYSMIERCSILSQYMYYRSTMDMETETS